jgi:hypothetical protein
MHEPSFQLWFAVRYLHVASVSLLAGGATLLAAWCLVLRPGDGADGALIAAPIYEWTFWLVVGLVAVTGVSNLGLKGEGLMSPATSWGRALTTKLAAVLTLLAISLLRSDFVIRCSAVARGAVSNRARAIAGWLYAATVAILFFAMWIGLGLAHGRY